MSLTVTQCRFNVRRLLGDLNNGAYAINNEQLTAILVRQAQMHRGLALPSESTENVTINNTGGNSFALATATVNRITKVVRSSDDFMLTKRSREEIDALTSGTLPTGPPTDYAVNESSPGGPITALLLYPAPVSADTLVVTRSTALAAAYADATELEGSEYLMRAIECATASEAALRMGQEARDKIKLSVEVIQSWTSDRVELMLLEKNRKRRLTAAPYVVQTVA